MQYALIILEGAIDESIVELNGMTPLEAANTPNIDVIAQAGRVGMCAASPTGMRPTPSSAVLSLLGCDPREVDPAAGPLTALARGIEVDPGDRVWRLTFLSAPDEIVQSPTVRSLDTPESRALVTELVEAWSARAPDLASRFRATAVDPTGCVLIESGGAAEEPVITALPIDLIGEQWRDGVPGDRESSAIARLIEIGAEALEQSEVNKARLSAGEAPVDVAWVWGGGPALTHGHQFAETFAMRGAMVGSAEHAVGAGKLIGLDRVPAPMGDDLCSLGEAIAGALDRYELVVAHVRTPAVASLTGDVGAKVRAIEEVDELVVGAALRRLDSLDRLGTSQAIERGADGFRIMVAATAEVACVDRGALDFPTLVAMGGAWMSGIAPRRMIERDAAASDLRVEPGHEILEFFLHSGLHVQTRKRRVKTKQTGGGAIE